MHRRRQIRQEFSRAFEGFFLGLGRMIDAARTGLDLPAAELGLLQRLPKPRHHRGTCDEHRRLLGHDGIMARRQARRAEPRDRTKPERHDGHMREIFGHVIEAARAADAAGQVRRALRLDRLHRAAAAGPLDHANDRQTKRVRRLFRHQRLRRDRSIRGTAAHGEIVADHNHRPAVDLGAAEHAVGRRHRLQVSVRLVLAETGDRAGLLERPLVDQLVDPLPDREPTGRVLAGNLVRTAHFERIGLAPGKLIQFGFPVHVGRSVSILFLLFERTQPRGGAVPLQLSF